MARARNIKPGFFKDAKVVSCSFAARLLFEGLWCIADYMGRLKYVPLEIKMEIFPADDINVEELIAELAKQNLIAIYPDHSGTTLVQVVNFTKHQNPHINERIGKDKEPLSCLPSEEECKPVDIDADEEKPSHEQQLKDALVLLREYSESDPADSLNLIPDSLNLIPDSLNLIPDLLPLGGEDEQPPLQPEKLGDISTPDPRKQFQMPLDWQPGKPLKDRCFAAGINLTEINEQRAGELLGEFCSYWNGQPDAFPESKWQHKFLTHLKKKKSDGDLYADKGSGSSTRGRSVGDDLKDRSWATA